MKRFFGLGAKAAPLKEGEVRTRGLQPQDTKHGDVPRLPQQLAQASPETLSPNLKSGRKASPINPSLIPHG